jgi:hypothetical protein
MDNGTMSNGRNGDIIGLNGNHVAINVADVVIQ